MFFHQREVAHLIPSCAVFIYFYPPHCLLTASYITHCHSVITVHDMFRGSYVQGFLHPGGLTIRGSDVRGLLYLGVLYNQGLLRSGVVTFRGCSFAAI